MLANAGHCLERAGLPARARGQTASLFWTSGEGNCISPSVLAQGVSLWAPEQELRASASTMIVAVRESKADPQAHAMQDFQDLAQAEKDCYDISGLLLQSTLRYISSEEKTVGTAK